MTQQKKTPLDLEEQIQSLAGDIYVQIEDRVSAFVANYSEPVELTNDIVEEHVSYQTLKKEFNALKSELDKSKESSSNSLVKLDKTIADLKVQLASRDESIKNNEQLNSAKLTDTELVLKEKLAELSMVSESLNKVTSENDEKTKILNESTDTVKGLHEKIATLESSENSLSKNDKAKAATLEVQNHQISDLTLQLNNTTSELDFLKADHSQQSASSNKQLSKEQNTVKQYQSEIIELKQTVNGLEQKLTTEKSNSSSLESKISELNNNVANSTKHFGDEKALTEKLNKDIIFSQEKAGELEQTLEKEKEVSKVLQTQMSGITKTFESTKKDLLAAQETSTNLTQKIELFKGQVTSLEESLTDEKQVSTKLKTDVNELTKTIESSKQSLSSEQQSVVKIKSELATLQKNVSDLTNTITQSDKLAKDTQVLLETERKSKGELQSKHLLEIDSLKQSIDKHRNEMESLAKNNDKYKAQLESLNHSIKELDETQQKQLNIFTEKEKAHELALASANKSLIQEQNLIKEIESKNKAQVSTMETLSNEHKVSVASSEKALSEQKIVMGELSSKIASSDKELVALRETHAKLVVHYEEANNSVDSYQQEIVNLKEKHDTAHQKLVDMKTRVEANKEKQEEQYNKARDTIKYLRDENLELSAKLDQEVSELEDKIREYRLRFEYAQKQLNSK